MIARGFPNERQAGGRYVRVVSVAPASESRGVSGYDFYYDADEADAAYERALADEQGLDGAMRLRLVDVQLTNATLAKIADAITEQLEEQLDEVEGTLPALRDWTTSEVASR